MIYASLTGYGESGPDRDRPGFDATAYFARSGLLDAQRYEGGPPGVPGPAQGDRATAMALVSSILMALMHRTKTGEGSWVGTSLLGNGLWSCGVIAQAALVGAFLEHRPPPERPRSALGNIYRTADDRWLQLTIVRTDKLWAPLCEAMGLGALINLDTKLDGRVDNAPSEVIVLEHTTSGDGVVTALEVLRVMSRRGLPLSELADQIPLLPQQQRNGRPEHQEYHNESARRQIDAAPPLHAEAGRVQHHVPVKACSVTLLRSRCSRQAEEAR